MILSVRCGVAFLCNYKSASRSIEAAMAPHADVVFSGTPKLKHLPPKLYLERVLPLVRLRHPDAEVESFCIMREPLAWARSWYRYRCRPWLRNPTSPNHHNYAGNMTFDAFIEAVMADDPPPPARIGRQSRFICGEHGTEPLVDRVFPFDRLDRVGAYLSDRFDVEVTLPRMNVSPRPPTSLDPDLEARFREALALDFQLYDGLR